MNNSSVYGNKKAAVVIPFYKGHLSELEETALRQCGTVLSNHDIIAVKPERLALPEAASIPFLTKVISFSDGYFENIAGYNKLMLSAEFYEAFAAYDFILIHQLDAFVFKDELDYWCNQGFDYIGAPWLRDIDHVDLIKAIKSNFKYYIHTRFDVYTNGEPSRYQYENKVGNGGFSLRNVKKFAALCHHYRDKIAAYLAKGDVHHNEDRFWSIEVNRKKRQLNIPGYKIGARFAVEHAIPRGIKLNNGGLPFGCHAWDKNVEAWRPIFKLAGCDI